MFKNYEFPRFVCEFYKLRRNINNYANKNENSDTLQFCIISIEMILDNLLEKLIFLNASELIEDNILNHNMCPVVALLMLKQMMRSSDRRTQSFRILTLIFKNYRFDIN